MINKAGWIRIGLALQQTGEEILDEISRAF
jgi:hypothetical protein